MATKNGSFRSMRVSAAARRRAVGSALWQQAKTVQITPGQRATIVRSGRRG